MSWQTSLLDASFRGVTFHCESTADSVQRSLARHEYPFRQGGELDDMGRKARECPLVAVFFGPQYETELKAFLTALDAGGEGELVHPVFGSLPVMVAGYDAPHKADEPDSCRVKVTFVESGQDNPFFNGASTPGGKADAAAASAGSAMDAAREASGVGFSTWVQEQLASMPGAGVLAVIGGVFSVAAAMYQDIAGGFDLAINYLDFPQALLAQMEGAVAKAKTVAGLDDTQLTNKFRGWQRLSGLLSGVGVSGKRKQSTGTGAQNMPGSPAPAAPPTPAEQDIRENLNLTTPAGQAAAHVAVIANVAEAAVVVEAVGELLRDEATHPTLNPVEVETIVSDTRSRLQECILLARAVYPPRHASPLATRLQDAALAVQDLGRAVINLRPPLVGHGIEAACNHHLLAHRLYGDHTRADELLRLNPQVRTPNFFQRGQTVNGYAK